MPTVDISFDSIFLKQLVVDVKKLTDITELKLKEVLISASKHAAHQVRSALKASVGLQLDKWNKQKKIQKIIQVDCFFCVLFICRMCFLIIRDVL